ncbi:MAG: maleylpyruvate isomerase N-terminal domain-containing protein [Acidimicrobiales bacterium]
MEVTGPLLSAAVAANRLLGSAQVLARWDQPSALDDYSVGGLAGHLFRAIGRIEVLLAAPEPRSARIVGVAEFFGAARIETPSDRDSPFQRAARRDGERAGAAGARAVASGFDELVHRLVGSIEGVRPERLVPVLTIPDAATTFEDYLRTRVVELVVHTDDLAVSCGLDAPQPPDGAATIAIGVLMELARSRHGSLAVIRGLARVERAQVDCFRAL